MSDFPIPNFSIDLSGQVALVTGSATGLGRRFARVLAAAGAKVAIAGRRVGLLEELAREIDAAGGVSVPIRIDMTDTDSIIAAVDAVEQALGTITILVNNAAIPDAQRANKMSIELINAVIDTNLRGPFVLACEVARRLINRKLPGRMVNMSSMAAFKYDGNSAAALYSITKAGIVRMTETLAVEWARFGINVNGIAPGAFASEMVSGMIQRVGDFSVNFPRKRFGDPAQMDSTLLYLVSPSSEFVTGTVIKVDDGQSAR